MLEQRTFDIRHITVLRKAVMERRSGVASFWGQGWDSTFPFERGLLLADVSERLVQVLQEPVFGFDWKDSVCRGHEMTIPIMPRQAVSQAIASLELPDDRLAVYRKLFSRLPGVTVRCISTFRFNLEYQKLFQVLYRMSLADGGTCLADYFAAAADAGELRKRVNIVIAAYCMGDLQPAVKRGNDAIAVPESDVAAADVNRVNIVSRIMARLWRN